MTISAYKSFSTKKTSQKKPIPGREQEMVENSEGGYVFQVSKWELLDRFLILGTSGGTYYVEEKELTDQDARVIMQCLNEDPNRVVNRVGEISDSGRAVSNDPALFTLAMAMGHKTGSVPTSVYVTSPIFQSVVRTSTHLFHFLEFVKQFRGWGRGLRTIVSDWYNDKSPEDLAYQVVKYRQRDGWTHQDVLRLAHPTPATPAHDAIFAWVCKGDAEEGWERWRDKFNKLSGKDKERLDRILAFESAKNPEAEEEDIVSLITNFNLTREMIPTQARSKKVWEALLQRMPLWATVRNLGNMGKAGLLVPGNWDAVNLVVDRLHDEDYILKSRMHPLRILIGMKTYASGSGFRGSSTWPVVSQVVDALNDAFYLAFGNVDPTNKKLMLALDVSGSMRQPIGGYPISCAEGVGALALVTANVEPMHVFTAFSSSGDESVDLSSSADSSRFSLWSVRRERKMSQISISPRERLDDVVRRMDEMNFGGTDCALPMLYAMEYEMDIDAFVVYTDNETWAGDIHPMQALQMYRDKYNKRAKLVVVGMTATSFSIADPNDPGTLDVVGFDTSTPTLISEFVRD